MTSETSPSFDDLFADATEPVRAIAARLRDLIREVDPETIEVIRPGDRVASYQVGPRKMKDGYCYIQAHKQWANLGFYRGAELDDPAGLLEGTGAAMRHVKVRSVAEADASELRALVERAVADRRC